MADEFLPPVVTKLKGDVHDLLDAIAEAKAAMAAYDKQVQDNSVKSAAATGKTSGNALVDELRRAVRDGRLADQDVEGLTQRFNSAFRKAGADGAASLYQELAKALGTGGLDSTTGRALVNSFDQMGKTGAIAFNSPFKAGFLSGLGDLAGSAGPVLVPMGVQLASLILAGMGGLLEGATGVGGVITGSLIQLKSNADVQSAAKGFWSWLSGVFKDDTAAFAQPLEDAFSILKTDLSSGGLLDSLKKDFSYLAPYVRDFAMFLGAAMEKALPGFNTAVQRSGPLLEEFGHDMVYVADGISTFFDQVSQGGKGEVEALDTLGRSIGDLLGFLGSLINYGAHLYEWFIKLDDAVAHFGADFTPLGALFEHFFHYKERVDGIANSFDSGGSSISGFAKKVNSLTTDVDRQKAEVDKLTKAWNDWFGVSMTLDQATLTYHQDVTALTDSIAQNGRTFDENTKAGQANYGALLVAIQGAHDLRDAQIASGTSAAQANAQYQASVNYLITLATKAGLSKDQIALLKSQVDQLVLSLQNLDKNVNTAHLSQLVGHGWTLGQGLAEGGYVAPGGIIHAAEGLLPPRSPGTLVLAGEPQTGGEVMIPQRGISQARAAALGTVAMAPYGMTVGLAGSSGGGGSDRPIVVQLMLPDGRVLWEQYILPGALQTKRQYGQMGL